MSIEDGKILEQGMNEDAFIDKILEDVNNEIAQEDESVEAKAEDTEHKVEDTEQGVEGESSDEVKPDSDKDEKNDNETILGKTSEEIDEIISKRAEEVVQKREEGIKESYEAQKNEVLVTNKMREIEQSYMQYEQAVQQLDAMLNEGLITPYQYKDSINQAVIDMNTLRNNYDYLKQVYNHTSVPRVKRANDAHYKQLQSSLPELKDPIVSKYANKLKNDVYDVGGIDIAQGGFDLYVKEFIAAAMQEGEVRGYQKAKNELQKQEAKAKAKSAVQSSDSRQSKSSLSTAEDLENASTDDIVKYMLS